MITVNSHVNDALDALTKPSFCGFDNRVLQLDCVSRRPTSEH